MNSIDTFQLYIESLDSSSPLNQAPAKPSRAIPTPPDDSFDTSYVDSVIFGGGGVAATADPEESNCDFIGTPDPAFTSQASFKSEEVSQIDSGLSSPENVGSFTRPSFLQLNSFMIWNDPDQGNPDANGFPASQRATSPLSDLSSPTESWPASKTEEEEAQETTTGTTIQPVYPGAPPGSLNMKTMKKRGLFSRSATAGGAAALGHNELSDVSVSDLKMPKSPTNSTSQLNSSSGNSVGAGGLNAEQDEDRFNGDGVMFHGKLIGSEYVAEARGEQMCQQSLKKLKIIQKAMGGHKRRIHLYISFDGIKIQDSLTTEQLFHHTVPQISFISRDETDTRAFGYVFGNSTTGHQFIGIKTKKEAMVVMTTIGQLFAITLKRKRSAEEAAALAAASDGSSTSAAGPAVLVEGADEHMYHSVYDMEAGGRSSSRRSRTTSGNSDNAPIPALPPPISDGHHRRGHSSASASNSLAVNQPTTVKLAPPGGSSHTSNNVLFNEMDLFVGGAGGFDPHSVPVAGPANYAEKNPKLSSSSFEWANFDDDAANLSAAANVNSSSIMDDSTLNTISSISDMNVNASQLSSSKTLSQNDATTSGTLVARYNVKNHPKTGSSSTIASTNFDGADPFSDAFGSDDPFSGSLAAGASELSGSLGASTNFKPHDSHSAQMLANQFGSLHLDRSTGSFKSNLDLSNSFSKQSVDSTSSADRYAALSDIHNLSNSIFDSFGNKKSDLPSGAGNRKASNVPSKAAGGNLFGSRHGATPPPAQGNLFASGSFSQGSAFQSQQPSVPFVTTTAGHNVAMYGQQPMYHSAVTTPGVMMTSAGPVAVSMMAPVGSASQMMYNPAVSSVAMAMAPPMHNSLAHSAQWSAASTSSLPTAFGMPPEAGYYQQQQQQQQFMPGTSPLASSGFGAANIAVSSGNGGMLLQRNGNLQASSSSLFATPPIAAQSFSSSSPASSIPLNGSNGSMNRTTGELPPLFSDLDLLGKSKTAFPMQKQDQMFQQQQSLDSFTRNCSSPSSSQNQYPHHPHHQHHLPRPLSGQHSLPSSSVGTSSPEPSLPPPSPSPLVSLGLSSSDVPVSLSTIATSSQPAVVGASSVSHQSSFTSQWSVSSSIPPSSAYAYPTAPPPASTESSPPLPSSESSDPSTIISRAPLAASEESLSLQSERKGSLGPATSMMATLGTNTVTTTTSATSSISSSSMNSSLLNVSCEMTAQTSGKFETAFDEVFENESKANGKTVAKTDSSEQVLLPPEDEEEKEAEGKTADESEMPPKTNLAKASITSYESIVSESIKSIDLTPTSRPRPTLSRQSSTSSSNRDRTATPPAIPPRTDLQQAQTYTPPGHRPRLPGSASSTPPPLPPPNKATSSSSAYSAQYASSPYYPPPYGAYGPYGAPPPPPEMYQAEARRYRYPPPPPPNPWAHTSGHYEYLYPAHHAPPPPPPEHHHPPYYPGRAMDPNYPPHVYAPPPPPPHPAYDPYYRQSPYSPAIYAQSMPYSSSPAPLPPTSEGYGGEYQHYHQPPPPVPTSVHYPTLPYAKKANSSASSTPPLLDGSTPPPPSSSTVLPPLPNPSRRISSSSMIERNYSNPAPASYFATIGRSNSSASAALAEQASLPRTPPSSSHAGIPNYPPPPPPGSSHHHTGQAPPPPPYYGHQYYGGPPAEVNPYEYGQPSGSETPGFDHFYDIPRRKETEYSVPPNNQAVPSSLMAFNANMEQMIMKYHQGNSPVDPASAEPSKQYYGPGSPFGSVPPYGPCQQQQPPAPPKRYPYSLSSAELVAINSGCNSSNSSSGENYSSGSSGYSTSRLTPKNAPFPYGNANASNPANQYQPYYTGGASPLPQMYSQTLQPQLQQAQQPEAASQAQTQPWTMPTQVAASNVSGAQNLFDDNFGDNGDFDWAKASGEGNKSGDSSPPKAAGDIDDNNNSNDTVVGGAGEDSNGSSTVKEDSNGENDDLKKDKVKSEAPTSSPPERSIFVAKDDPFDDDFFNS